MKRQDEKNLDVARKKGFPLSKFNWLLEVILFVVSIFLLITTFRVNEGYQKLKATSDSYIEWERQAMQMEMSSDHLTREVRLFVQTKNVEHMRSYFVEVEENRTREKVLTAIGEEFSEDSKMYTSLKESLRQSHELQNLEYTAMRLTIESIEDGSINKEYVRREVIEAELPAEAESMTVAEKYQLAYEYVNGEEYFRAKEVIENGVNECIAELIEFVQDQQDDATRKLDLWLIQQRIWLALFIAAAVVIILATTFQIIRPLNRAVPFIKENKTIPVTGAEEFRILVNTYNRMHKMNQNYRDKLAYKASHDPLTGVLNRSGFEDVLHDVDLSDVALLIVDIDFFKNVNDEYGHEMGDRALEAVGQLLKASFRSDDVICRMGGDEFAVIMWHTGPEKKELIDGKIRQANDLLTNGYNDLPKMSLSVGVAFGQESEPENIFHDADKALYRTKTSGRCGCSFYSA